MAKMDQRSCDREILALKQSDDRMSKRKRLKDKESGAQVLCNSWCHGGYRSSKRERHSDGDAGMSLETSTFVKSDTILDVNEGNLFASNLSPIRRIPLDSTPTSISSQCQDDHRRKNTERNNDGYSDKSSERYKMHGCSERYKMHGYSERHKTHSKTDAHLGRCEKSFIQNNPSSIERYLRRRSVAIHLSKPCTVGDASGKDTIQSAESSILEEEYASEHSDYRESASSEEDVDESFSLPQSASPHHSRTMPQACRSIHEFQRLCEIKEGAYGVVFKALDKRTGETVAIKKVKMERQKDGFPITSLREINILLSMDHPSIVIVKEVAVGKDLETIYMVMEYIEQDLAGLLETHSRPFSQSEVKYMMRQLLEGVAYIHRNWVLHRDLKPSNLLLNRCGMLKICDFGLARQFGSPLKTYTHMVVSLWYRAPELLLGQGKYSTAIDMWSLGCIMAELLGKVPLFDGQSELDQLKKIVGVLGTLDEAVLHDKTSGVRFDFLRKSSKSKLREKFPPTSFTGKTPLSESGFNLLSRLLTYDPNKRISAEDAVKHHWFIEDPLPKPLTSI